MAILNLYVSNTADTWFRLILDLMVSKACPYGSSGLASDIGSGLICAFTLAKYPFQFHLELHDWLRLFYLCM